MELYQIKKLLHGQKNPIIKMQREPTKWEKIFVKDKLYKGLISKIYKELT